MFREIRHQFVIAAAPEVVASALTEATHLARWWTREVQMEGRHARLDWSAHGWWVELDLLNDTDRRRVVWHCTRAQLLGTRAWEGSSLCFALSPVAQGTRVDFSHDDYPESPCYELCVQGWAFFLGVSLKRYLEKGEGMPYPEMPAL